MISSSNLRLNFYKVMDLAMKGLSFEFSYRRDVYIMTIERTGRKVPHHRTGMKTGPRVRVNIKIKECPDCNGLIVDTLCLNKRCKSYSSPTLSSEN